MTLLKPDPVLRFFVHTSRTARGKDLISGQKRGARVAKAPRGKSLLGAHADTRMGSFTLIGTRVLRTVLITSIVVVVMVVENRARNDARVRDASVVTNKLANKLAM